MAKNYTDELAQWARKRQGKARERNLVTFHGLQDDVRAALDAGFSSKTIWAHMHEQGRVDFGYETFLSYVTRVIKTAPSARPDLRSGQDSTALDATAEMAAQPAALALPTTEPLPPPLAPSSTPITRRTGMPTFKFNPIPQREGNA